MLLMITDFLDFAFDVAARNIHKMPLQFANRIFVVLRVSAYITLTPLGVTHWADIFLGQIVT
jgi:hypothetical protein